MSRSGEILPCCKGSRLNGIYLACVFIQTRDSRNYYCRSTSYLLPKPTKLDSSVRKPRPSAQNSRPKRSRRFRLLFRPYSLMRKAKVKPIHHHHVLARDSRKNPPRKGTNRLFPSSFVVARYSSRWSCDILNQILSRFLLTIFQSAFAHHFAHLGIGELLTGSSTHRRF